MARGLVNPLKKYWAERFARWESEMEAIERDGRAMTPIRTHQLTPDHVPFVPSFVPTRTLFFTRKPRGGKTTRSTTRDARERMRDEDDKVGVEWR